MSETNTLRVAIAGCGLIGRRRAEVVCRDPMSGLVVVADTDRHRAELLAVQMGCEATDDWREMIARPDIDAVVVCTSNEWLAPVSLQALRNAKHVLVEKPMARTPVEAEAMVNEARDRRLKLAVGFNHRYYPSISKAHQMVSDGAIGDVLWARCRYGHGGRPGYEKEWRMDPRIAGGGELLDQGIHAIDLFRWFLGDLAEAFGLMANYFWHPGRPSERAGDSVEPSESIAEDNGFALFRTAKGQVASLHASCTQWKNLFSFEVFGRDGYLLAEGLGRSYGLEKLTWGRRRPESGPPEEQAFEFPGGDPSWEAELREFVAAIREHREPLSTGYSGLQAIKAVFAAYESSRTGRMVRM